MRNRVKRYGAVILVLGFLSLAVADRCYGQMYLLNQPTPEDLQNLAQIHTNILLTYIPESLKGMAQQLGKIRHRDSLTALEDLLRKCDEIEKQNPRYEVVEAVNVARAYAMFSLARLSKQFPAARRVIQDHFKISRPAGIALIKSRYPDMLKLVTAEIDRLFSEYPSVTRDRRTVNDIKSRYSGVGFIMDARFSEEPEAVEEELLDAMFATAVVIEQSHSAKALPVCRRLLSHEGAFYWEKLVYRAVANLAIHPSRRYEFLRQRLQYARNKARDDCTWDLSNPDSILFSIKNISSEAFLLLSMWRMPYSLQQKISDTVPALQSRSFTARAAAIDCLATTPASTRHLREVLYNKDPDTRRFLAIRLSTETNTIAGALLKRLVDDEDPAVRTEAFRWLK